MEILSWYVREHLPVLLKQPTDALFPGAGTKAKSSGALATQISKTMLKFTGLKVNVHLFRHAGGKIFWTPVRVSTRSCAASCRIGPLRRQRPFTQAPKRGRRDSILPRSLPNADEL